MSNTAHRFHIELEGIDPPVWRRIRVPGAYRFRDLHVAIQDAMGWLDCHLHLFHVRHPGSGAIAQIGIPDDEPFLSGRTSPATRGALLAANRYFERPSLRGGIF